MGSHTQALTPSPVWMFVSLSGDSEMERLLIVQPGEDIILNCSFQSELNHQPLNITWKKEEEEGPHLLVHRYCSELDPLKTQDEAYRGRTQLYPERFREGNASLRLKNVQLADDGIYTCHVKAPLTRHRTSPRVWAAGLLETAPRGGEWSSVQGSGGSRTMGRKVEQGQLPGLGIPERTQTVNQTFPHTYIQSFHYSSVDPDL
uniref:Ig-like domain-containing protein n=1 Tax=Chrysemys picta bellii TaxID=8478 RepID=A0A8C3HCG6_CHRPI